jgi:sugar/nucleoside kinase (ribokinase family)
MSRLLVSGLINLETTLRVDGFPVAYDPDRYPFFGVRSTVSGVGYNLARALRTLGHDVELLSLVGRDPAAELVHLALARDRLPAGDVLPLLQETPQSVILYDGAGRRQIHVDLKDAQQVPYPAARQAEALARCQGALLCNIEFSRPLLRPAREAGLLVATDVHAIRDLDDPYNTDFMRAAHLLFLSDERLPTTPEAWAGEAMARFPAEVVVVGLGAAGALLCVRQDGFVGRFPARQTRPVVSTIGAGDALCSAFVDGYLRHRDPYAALARAQAFASWKIGEAGAAEGFLDAATLEALTGGAGG